MGSSLFKILKNIPALSEIDEDDLKDISKKAVLVGYPKNNFIYNIGDESTHFFVIKSGLVDMIDENDKSIAKHYPDNCFGEFALLEGVPRKYKAKAIENSEIYLLDINDFKEFLYL